MTRTNTDNISVKVRVVSVFNKIVFYSFE